MYRILFGLLVVSLLTHFAFAKWLRAAFPAVSARLVYGASMALALFAPAGRLLSKVSRADVAGQIFIVSMFELSVLLFALFPLLFFRSIVARRKTVPLETEVAAKADASRRVFLERGVGALAYGSAAGMFGWGMVRGRHAYQIDELVVRVQGLPKALEGYTIAQISDIHVGALIGERDLREGFELITRVKPDALVLTGDLVDSDASYCSVLLQELNRLQIRDGIYGILGNHDHFADAEEVRNAMNAGGVRMLVNQHHVLRKREGGIALVGLDDLIGSRYGRQGYRLDRALKDLEPEIPRIILSHQPTSIERLWGGAALQLSGHTHGGQINPGFSPIKLTTRYVAGRYEVGNTSLYVNRGFGVVGPPARIGAPPEITKIVLIGG
jgi:uncharacterized protein